jgi:phosphoribosyl 1,2-cyclic phosphodiesterase
MKITIWGSRGSIPVPGRHTLKYGGNTSCVEVRLRDGTLIILDAGSGIRNLGKNIVQEEYDKEIYLVITHSHWDHMMGFPFFLPAYMKQYKINIRGGPIAKETVKKYIERQMEPPHFPIRFQALEAEFDITHGIPIVREIGDATLTPIALSHPNGGYGFRIKEYQNSFVFIPDNELDFHHNGGRTTDEYIRFCKDTDLLLHDAQYTDREYFQKERWGHSSFTSALELAISAGVKNFGLYHHDPDHSDEDMDRIVEVSKQVIQKKGIKMNVFAAAEGQKISIET